MKYLFCTASLFVVVGVVSSGCNSKAPEEGVVETEVHSAPVEHVGPSDFIKVRVSPALERESTEDQCPPEPVKEPDPPAPPKPDPASAVPLAVAVKDFKRAINRVINTAENRKGGH